MEENNKPESKQVNSELTNEPSSLLITRVYNGYIVKPNISEYVDPSRMPTAPNPNDVAVFETEADLFNYIRDNFNIKNTL